jgi:hypothetical protein
MGDGGSGIFRFENRIDVEVTIAESARQDVQSARKALEEAVRRIPEAALRGFRGFRISVMA